MTDIEEELLKFTQGFAYRPKKRKVMKNWYFNDYIDEWLKIDGFDKMWIAEGDSDPRFIIRADSDDQYLNLARFETKEEALAWMNKFMRQHD